MQRIKILLMLGPCGRDEWMWKISQEMSKRSSFEFHFISFRDQETNFLVSQGVEKNKITQISSFPKNIITNTNYLKECEERYNLNIWEFWNYTLARDKKRAKIPKKEVLGYFQFAFEKIHEIISLFKPDYYLYYGVAGYNSALFTEVLKLNKVHILELASTPIPGRFTFLRDLKNMWSFLPKTYEQIKQEGLDQFSKQYAIDYLHSFKNRPKKPDVARKYSETLLNNMKRNLQNVKKVIKYRNVPSNLRFVFWPVIQKLYDNMNLFEKPKEKERFVFFPLHFQPEATTLIYGKWFVDQVPLIENIARSIPITHKLYVKEHPYGYGNRNLEFYKRIKRIPNVRLIGPRENNFKLIKNCSLLTTITGTGGWEALLFGKNVFTFGDVYYNVCDEVTKIKDIRELPQLIKNKVDKKIDDKKITWCIAAMYKCSYPGLARLPSDCKNQSLEDKNIENLTDAIIDQITKISPNLA